MAWIATSDGRLQMPFHCPCGFTTTVLVQAKGAASGAFPGQGLSQRAYESMFANAAMRAEMNRCPKCGQRSFATFVREIVRWLLVILGAGVVVTGIAYVKERNFGLDTLAMIGIAIAVLELTVLVGFVFEYRASQRAVTFPPPEA